MTTPREKFCVAITTASDEDQARSLASSLLAEGLAACVQILPMRSLYLWQNKVADEAEYLLLIKTRRALYEEVEALLRSEHSYDVPEVICVPIDAGSDPYLAWIQEVTKS